MNIKKATKCFLHFFIRADETQIIHNAGYRDCFENQRRWSFYFQSTIYCFSRNLFQRAQWLMESLNNSSLNLFFGMTQNCESLLVYLIYLSSGKIIILLASYHAREWDGIMNQNSCICDRKNGSVTGRARAPHADPARGWPLVIVVCWPAFYKIYLQLYINKANKIIFIVNAVCNCY